MSKLSSDVVHVLSRYRQVDFEYLPQSLPAYKGTPVGAGWSKSVTQEANTAYN